MTKLTKIKVIEDVVENSKWVTKNIVVSGFQLLYYNNDLLWTKQTRIDIAEQFKHFHNRQPNTLIRWNMTKKFEENTISAQKNSTLTIN